MIAVPRLPPNQIALETAMGMLLDRLEGEVKARTPDTTLCAKVVLPGDTTIMNYGTEDCGGFVYVRLTAATPSQVFPTPIAQPDPCVHTLAYSVEMGCLRPAPGEEFFLKDVHAPTPEAMFEAASGAYRDLDAMYATNAWAQGEFANATMGTYEPIGPNGGIVGGLWNFVFGLAEG